MCVCVIVVSVIVKLSGLPSCAEDRRHTNPLYYLSWGDQAVKSKHGPTFLVSMPLFAAHSICYALNCRQRWISCTCTLPAPFTTPPSPSFWAMWSCAPEPRAPTSRSGSIQTSARYLQSFAAPAFVFFCFSFLNFFNSVFKHVDIYTYTRHTCKYEVNMYRLYNGVKSIKKNKKNSKDGIHK